jgi:hypothetical protein
VANRNLVKHHNERGANGPEGGKLYAGIPTALARDGELSAYARSVALYVWSHTEDWHQSTVSVAEAIGTNRKQVSNARAELQERGWLVREVHYRPPGPSGKPRIAWECWHLQMSNIPFSPEEIVLLSGARLDEPCCPEGHGGDPERDTGGAAQRDTIGMDTRNASVGMHSRNGTSPESGPLQGPSGMPEDKTAELSPWEGEPQSESTPEWDWVSAQTTPVADVTTLGDSGDPRDPFSIAFNPAETGLREVTAG